MSVRLCLVGLGLAALVVRSGVPGRWLLAPGEAKQVKEGSPSGAPRWRQSKESKRGFGRRRRRPLVVLSVVLGCDQECTVTSSAKFKF